MNVRAIDPTTLKNAPLKAAILVDVDDTLHNPEGYLSIIRKAPAAAGKGTLIANLAGAPSKTETDTFFQPFEDLYSKTGDLKGDIQWESTRAEISFSPVSHTLDVLKLIYPGSKFENIFGADGTTKVGVRRKSGGRIALTDYHKNVVLCWTTVDKTVACAYIIREAINVEEDKSYTFNDDGSVFAIDCTLRAHSTGESLDPETGQVLPNFEELDFGITLPSA